MHITLTSILFAAFLLTGTGALAQQSTSRPAEQTSTLPTDAVAAAAPAPTEAPSPSLLHCDVVMGRVLNHENRPLVGATVMTKDARHVASTNSEGVYVMNVPAAGVGLLQFSSAGYQDKQVSLSSCNPVIVNLEPDPTVKIKTRHNKLIIKKL